MVVGTGQHVLTGVHWSLYRRAGPAWQVVPEVAEEFRLRVDGSAPAPGAAVYLTQPWPDLGVMSERAYLDHLSAVRDASARAGLALVLRPHPSESPARYRGFALTAGTGPAELDREVTEASVVVGSNSTALLNLAAVHGTPCRARHGTGARPAGGGADRPPAHPARHVPPTVGLRRRSARGAADRVVERPCLTLRTC